MKDVITRQFRIWQGRSRNKLVLGILALCLKDVHCAEVDGESEVCEERSYLELPGSGLGRFF